MLVDYVSTIKKMDSDVLDTQKKFQKSPFGPKFGDFGHFWPIFVAYDPRVLSRRLPDLLYCHFNLTLALRPI